MARYLVNGDYVDPGPMLPPQQLVQMIEKLVLMTATSFHAARSPSI
jgi:hypothetical protein